MIGREFPVAALEHVAGESTRDDLAVLLRAEIVREVRRYPELHCAFRHGLLQDAALTTLTPSTRRELYARVAAAFEELYAADSLDDHLERLAHYHAQAGDDSGGRRVPRARGRRCNRARSRPTGDAELRHARDEARARRNAG